MMIRILPGVLAIIGTLVVLRITIPIKTQEEATPTSSADCQSCHPDVWEEWNSSHHAYAFKNPEVRRLSQNFMNQECLACHAPQPVLAFSPGERVLARQADRGLGVDCLSCHAHPEGGIATANPRPNIDAPCAPRTESRTSSVETCGSCHNQHGTVDQWKQAPPHLKKENCLSCHMESTFRMHGRQGKNHSFPAAHSLESLQKAITLNIKKKNPLTTDNESKITILISVTNDGCGHNFPTDERSRAADIQWRQKVAGQWKKWEHLYRFRDPYRDEANLENTQLPAGESSEHTIGISINVEEIESRVIYRTNPFQSDEDATEIFRKGITL